MSCTKRHIHLISPEGSSRHDIILDCFKLSYLDNLNQMSDLEPGIDPHMPILIQSFKDVVLILFYFHVAFKVEPLTFTRLIRGDKDPFVLTHYIIYIIWTQKLFLQVTVGFPSFRLLLSGLT